MDQHANMNDAFETLDAKGGADSFEETLSNDFTISQIQAGVLNFASKSSGMTLSLADVVALWPVAESARGRSVHRRSESGREPAGAANGTSVTR